jgi:hypothetical protein
VIESVLQDKHALPVNKSVKSVCIERGGIGLGLL